MTSSSIPTKKIKTTDDWNAIFAQQKNSGQSIQKFCEANNINYNTFRHTKSLIKNGHRGNKKIKTSLNYRENIHRWTSNPYHTIPVLTQAAYSLMQSSNQIRNNGYEPTTNHDHAPTYKCNRCLPNNTTECHIDGAYNNHPDFDDLSRLHFSPERLYPSRLYFSHEEFYPCTET